MTMKKAVCFWCEEELSKDEIVKYDGEICCSECAESHAKLDAMADSGTDGVK